MTREVAGDQAHERAAVVGGEQLNWSPVIAW